MSRVNDLVTAVNALVDEYGYTAVTEAVNFVNMFNQVDTGSTVTLVTHNQLSGVITAKLSKDQYNLIRNEWIAGNKIQGIKLLREYTNLGLKEAKDLCDATNW